MKSSFIVTTRNRRNELARCVQSLVRQTIPPHEVVIVDASDDPDEESTAKIFSGSGIPLRYDRSRPGRTYQLNRAIEIAAGDLLCFFDDDAEVDPAWHAVVLSEFDKGGSDLGGVQGIIVNDYFPSAPIRFYRKLFFLMQRTADKPGRLLASGYYRIPVRPKVPLSSSVLVLTNVAYRRDVVDRFKFDEYLEGSGFKEDIDFSWRASRHFRLLITPHARIIHNPAPGGRTSNRAVMRLHIRHNRYLFEKNLEGTARQQVAFAWAMLGRLLFMIAKSIRRSDASYLLGTVDGLRDLIGRRSVNPPSTERDPL